MLLCFLKSLYRLYIIYKYLHTHIYTRARAFLSKWQQRLKIWRENA
uniref:Uncharacterized protein n=1 Tax=Siphoviridae sp. ctEJj1 TaxID=2825395 RepID=A0A8S5U6H0_9CAUD|nr:MAG TPA: hypothetical protein [Siphoviridae sp. ctEJj1]